MTIPEKVEPEIEIPLTAAIPFAEALPAPVEENSSTNPTGSTKLTSSTTSSTSPKPSSSTTQPAQRTVDVLAPSDLPAGFEFYVDDPATPNVSLLVQVPAGGVRATQRFAAIVIRQVSRGLHNIPNGRWRDGLCDCCNHGCCHPQFCLTFWCTPCALGQVLTRMKLNACANPKQAAVEAGCTAFQILFAVQVASILFNIAVSSVVNYYIDDDYATTVNDDIMYYEQDLPGWVDALSYVRSAVAFGLYVFLLLLTCRLRRYVRNKYQIPENTCCCKEGGGCRGCEDFCCAFWCQTCSICQIARHTADYYRYKAGCCTGDGLAAGEPSVV